MSPRKPTTVFSSKLIGWRELSVLFVRHEPNYDNWECAAPWARKTLIEHTADPRPYRYTLAQLERPRPTTTCGTRPSARWSTPAGCTTTCACTGPRRSWNGRPTRPAPSSGRCILNDRYQLDGRDPNGYAGIAWAIVGRHDRPWFNRPVFGLVRPMSGHSLARKFDAQAYIRQNPVPAE